MPISLYDASDVIPNGFDGSAFEKPLKAAAAICAQPFSGAANAFIYMAAVVWMIKHGQFDNLRSPALLNNVARSLAIPSWRILGADDGVTTLDKACAVIRCWLDYRCRWGGSSNVIISYDDDPTFRAPLKNSIMDILLRGGATAVQFVPTGINDYDVTVYVNRADDLIWWNSDYTADTPDASFSAYMQSVMRTFAPISAGAHIYVTVSAAISNRVLYYIWNERMETQYNAITDAYFINGAWISRFNIGTYYLTESDQVVYRLHEENVNDGSSWTFALWSTKYFIDKFEAYPYAAPFTHGEIVALYYINMDEVTGWEAATYDVGVYANTNTGMTQPSITAQDNTLPYLGYIGYMDMRYWFEAGDLVDGEVYSNDGLYTPTPCKIASLYGRRWYFLYDTPYQYWVYDSNLEAITGHVPWSGPVVPGQAWISQSFDDITVPYGITNLYDSHGQPLSYSSGSVYAITGAFRADGTASGFDISNCSIYDNGGSLAVECYYYDWSNPVAYFEYEEV